MYNTKVKIERFKQGGKFLETLEYHSKIECYETIKLKEEAIKVFTFLTEEIFTLEVKDLNSEAWNKYLVNGFGLKKIDNSFEGKILHKAKCDIETDKLLEYYRKLKDEDKDS